MKITKDDMEAICFNSIIPKWHQQPEDFSQFLPVMAEKQKGENEKVLENFRKIMLNRMKAFPEKEKDQPIWKEKLEEDFLKFVENENIIHIREAMNQELFQAFWRETRHFVRRTRDFDNKLSIENIWQAIRNFFIYAVIVDLQENEQNCEEPIFSYSLLYPYTDNFIDDTRKRKEEKESYNEMIKRTICGEDVEASGECEKKTQKLLLNLLSFDGFPDIEEIRNALLLILDAQMKSMIQQSNIALTYDDILQVSVYKGALSVYVDYLFASSNRREEDTDFYLKFGFLLQVVDDLQDICDDLKDESKTLMTYHYREGSLEAVVNKLLHYTYAIFQEFLPKNPKLKEFMMQNCFTMILITVASNQAYFSRDYLVEIERYLPFQQDYLKGLSISINKNISKRFAKVTDNGMTILDTIVK